MRFKCLNSIKQKAEFWYKENDSYIQRNDFIHPKKSPKVLKLVMNENLILIFYLICICSGDYIARPFLYSGSTAVGIDKIIQYFGSKNDNIRLEQQSIDNTEEGISSALSSIHDSGNDTVFAYLADTNFTMLNEYAVKYNMYIWNAVPYPEDACFTNIIFGYDSPLTSLKSIMLLFYILL